TLTRPEAMNAVDRAVADGVGQALEEADRDRDVWVLVITGAGERSFSAGADLKALARGESIMPALHPEWGFGGYVNHVIGKPTIAAVNGFALGGGTEIALASDLCVASRSARFGLPEVKRGIMAGAGGLIRLPAQLPRKVAMEMILTGEPIDADVALRWGLVNRVVDGNPLEAALELAASVSENAPLAVQASKRVALRVVEGGLPDEALAWQVNRREAAAVMATEDAREGTRAFAEKRRPVWRGR
ncbi:MAG TPA: enoyl-CoA hydratase-related protein, partial [Candidatus Eisenbacteria bacterium]|nr:enoyl-CoA hydratase-related protein [Candidatus Eisenbacteria bacterium]